jgi:hypothetical protein
MFCFHFKPGSSVTSLGAPTLSKLLGTPPTTPCKSTTTQMAAAVSQSIKDENKKQLIPPSPPVAASANASIVAQDQGTSEQFFCNFFQLTLVGSLSSKQGTALISFCPDNFLPFPNIFDNFWKFIN